MSKRFINGSDFANMIFSGAKILQSQVKRVNDLNVFPVPDGDTGTNMNMTLTSGVEMLKNKPNADISKAADLFAKGLLMGARGNSGVILSQLFRGFAKSVSGLQKVNASQFAAALQQGVDTAYQAVVKPVEGTILTVSREAAQHGIVAARRTSNLLEIMREVLDKARETLLITPNLLPVLKQAGVVDSGGQGLVFIYEGFWAALQQEVLGTASEVQIQSAKSTADSPSLDIYPKRISQQPSAQAKFNTEEIEFPYDMEFFIHISSQEGSGMTFDLDYFRKALAKDGDSILVIPDEEIIKVHVHTKAPGNVLNLAIRYGELRKFHIENMRDQHEAILNDREDANVLENLSPPLSQSAKPYGVVAVAIGDGISEIFTSLGADFILSGGQTMNPSTEDIVEAIRQVNAEKTLVLPNNSNIILAAQQAKDLMESEITVIPTVSIPQGMAAMFAFQDSASIETNTEAMNQAIQQVKSGQVTYAVRDSKFDDIDIREGDFLGIYNSKIVTAKNDMLAASKTLLHEMIAEEDEILTILVGKDASEEQSHELVSFLEETYPQLEIETHRGGQPLYYYIFSVE